MSLAKYIKENWAKIAMTWIDGDLEQFPAAFLEGGGMPEEVPWSCLSCASFMLKLYGHEYKRNFTEITDVSSFVTSFESGYLYHFSIFCHEFIVIYGGESDGIFYIDYYFETEREEKMRVERVSRDCVLEYLRSYLTEDFSAHAKFHKGSDSYRRDYAMHYNQCLEHKDSAITGLWYSKHAIMFTPSCADVVETVLSSADDYEEDMKGNELYVQARSRVLASFN